MDRKSVPKKGQKKSGKRTSNKLPRGMRWNQMFYRTQWEFGVLTSTTSGNISVSSISPSIQSSSEYSVLQNLFTEIRLLSCVVTFTSVQLTPTAGTLHGHLWVGTNMVFNYATNTPPMSVTSVQNLSGPRKLSTYSVKPTSVQLVVPPSLEFTNIVADAPTLPSPWAGSPGCMVVWSDNLSASIAYFRVDVMAKYHLRGRQ